MSWIETLVVNSRVSDIWRKWSLRRVMREVQDVKGQVLEIGCGKGTTTKLIANKLPSARIVATDFDDAQILTAKCHATSRIIFRQADASALLFKNNTFAVGFAFLTFHHVPNWKKAVSEMYRVLKPNGRLYIEELALKPFPFFKHLFMHAPSIFTKQEFFAELQKVGFRVEKFGGGYKFWIVAVKE